MIELARNLVRHRELVVMLAKRELSARYRPSVLGPAWAVLHPLALLGAFLVLGRFTTLRSEGLPYPVFAYAGLLPWTFFTGALGAMAPSLVANAAIVRKVPFPREVVPAAAALGALADLVFALPALVALMVIYGVPPTGWTLFLPVVLAIEAVFALAIGLLVSAVTAFYRDLVFASVFLLQLWMFASPVLYPLSAVPLALRGMYLLNPMAGLVTTFRSTVVFGQPPEFATLAPAALVSGAALVVGYRVFKALEPSFADVM